MAKKLKFTKKDKVHYIIFRELDILKIQPAYKIASLIVDSLLDFIRKVVASERALERQRVREMITEQKEYSEQSVPNDEYSVGYYDGHAKALSSLLLSLEEPEKR